ncbi:MAG: Large repetitive protein, partial [Rhizobacter sp.]|nr:Large repetitive protein [Rhizobacter sp.]
VSGTGEAGSTAAVFDDVNNNGVIDTGESSASVLVGADGTFSVDVAVGEGVRHVRSILTDAFGNAGAASATTTVTVDATAPLAPATLVVAENADGGINGTEAADGVLVEVPLAGAMGAAGDLVRLTWMGSQTVDHVITATEAALGTASVLVSAALVDLQGGDGDASVAAQLIDVAGNAGPMSAVTTVSINRSPPADQIDWQGLAAADDSGVSDADGITNHASALTFGGVTVLPADTLAGVAAKIFNDVNDNGAVDPGEAVLAVVPLVPTQPMWNSFSVDLDLAEGFYNLRAVVVDSTGNEGQMSAARPITIDTTAPAASRIDRVTDDNLVDFPEQAVGITAKGTAEADSSVHLQFSSGLSKIFAADVGGVWSCFLTPAELLNMGDASGSESLTVTLTDRAGNVSEAALRQFTMF